MSETSSKVYEEQWIEVPQLKRIVLARPPRVPGYLHLFGFAVSREELFQLSLFAFKRLYRGYKGLERDSMINNGPGFIADLFRLPVCFPAIIQPAEKVDVPSDCYHPLEPGAVRLLVVWQSCEPGQTCPYPWHLRLFQDIIGRPPRWWLDDAPEWA